MDRATVSALIVTGASVFLSLILKHDARSSTGHAMLLVLLLVIIAFPEAIEAGFRSTLRVSARSGEEPTPGVIIRVAAFGLLVIVVIVYHTLSFCHLPR